VAGSAPFPLRIQHLARPHGRAAREACRRLPYAGQCGWHPRREEFRTPLNEGVTSLPRDCQGECDASSVRHGTRRRIVRVAWARTWGRGTGPHAVGVVQLSDSAELSPPRPGGASFGTESDGTERAPSLRRGAGRVDPIAHALGGWTAAAVVAGWGVGVGDRKAPGRAAAPATATAFPSRRLHREPSRPLRRATVRSASTDAA
jgi:hypothetical protein